MSRDDQQRRGGFVPIGELAGTLPGIVPRGRAMTAQTRHHLTMLRQVNQLIEASEAEPDIGFMARLLALCSLPGAGDHGVESAPAVRRGVGFDAPAAALFPGCYSSWIASRRAWLTHTRRLSPTRP